MKNYKKTFFYSQQLTFYQNDQKAKSKANEELNNHLEKIKIQQNMKKDLREDIDKIKKEIENLGKTEGATTSTDLEFSLGDISNLVGAINYTEDSKIPQSSEEINLNDISNLVGALNYVDEYQTEGEGEYDYQAEGEGEGEGEGEYDYQGEGEGEDGDFNLGDLSNLVGAINSTQHNNTSNETAPSKPEPPRNDTTNESLPSRPQLPPPPTKENSDSIPKINITQPPSSPRGNTNPSPRGNTTSIPSNENSSPRRNTNPSPRGNTSPRGNITENKDTPNQPPSPRGNSNQPNPLQRKNTRTLPKNPLKKTPPRKLPPIKSNPKKFNNQNLKPKKVSKNMEKTPFKQAPPNKMVKQPVDRVRHLEEQVRTLQRQLQEEKTKNHELMQEIERLKKNQK